MLFKLQKKFLEDLIIKLPYLRYNDTNFYYIEESYFSKNGEKEKTWVNPKESVIHRLTANIPLNAEKVNFEENKKDFINFCNNFFDNSRTKTFANLKNFLIIGNLDNLKYSEISNWKVIEDLLYKTGLKEYFSINRYLIRIPCGSLNLNIIKIEEFEDLYLEITEISPSEQEKLNLIKDLALNNQINDTWVSLKINHSISEES